MIAPEIKKEPFSTGKTNVLLSSFSYRKHSAGIGSKRPEHKKVNKQNLVDVQLMYQSVSRQK